MQIADEVKEFTCIKCPLGCRVEVSFDAQGEVADVSGYSCARGKEYALAESTDPRRMVTSLVFVRGCLEPVSVKTSQAIPKAKITEVLAAIHNLVLEVPIKAGDVLAKNVGDSGADIIATKDSKCP